MNAHASNSPHAHATALRSVADDIHRLSQRVHRQVDTTHFEGPVADRFRVAMNDRRHRLQGVARDLQELADVVMQDTGATAGH